MFGKIFSGVKKAKQGSNYGARLPPGQSRVTLKKYGPKPTEKEDSKAGSYLIESQFRIDSTTATDVKVGDTRDWPWFVQAPSWGGSFARQNAQQMLTAIMGSIDMSELPMANVQLPNGTQKLVCFNIITNQPILEEDDQSPSFGQPKTEHDVATVGELASYGFFRGIQLSVSVEPSYNKKTKQFNKAPDGTPYYDAKWSAVPGQKLETIIATGLSLDDPEAAPAPKAAAQQQPTQNMGGYSVPAAQPAAQAQPAFPAALQTNAELAAAQAQPVVQQQPAATPAPAANSALSAMLAKLKPNG